MKNTLIYVILLLYSLLIVYISVWSRFSRKKSQNATDPLADRSHMKERQSINLGHRELERPFANCF